MYAMTDIQVEVLLQRLAGGDAEALPPLMVRYYPVIRRAVGDRVPPGLIQDCAQDTSLRIWEAVKDGRFCNEGIPQFVSFVKTIAWREARKYITAAGREESLVRERDGEEVEWDVPAPESAERAVETPLLLDDILNKALIDAAIHQAGRDVGLLKKLAFHSFYVDHLPQREIARVLSRYASTAELNVSITEDVLNNWLSGGRILKTVIGYVVRHRGTQLALLVELRSEERRVG